jgi:hypothetical protein
LRDHGFESTPSATESGNLGSREEWLFFCSDALFSPAFQLFHESKKLVFPARSFAVVGGLRSLIKPHHEGRSIGWCGEPDGDEGQRDRLGAGVREADAEIQHGGRFGRVARPDPGNRLLVFFAVRRGYLDSAMPNPDNCMTAGVVQYHGFW